LRPVHYLTIAVSLTVVLLLFFFANTVPPAKPAMAGAPGGMPPRNRSEVLPDDSLVSAARARLSEGDRATIKAQEDKLKPGTDSASQSAVFSGLGQSWQDLKEPKMAAYYSGISAKLENSEKKLTFAARLFIDLMLDEENPAIRLWEAQKAVDLAERSYQIDTSIEETKLTLATGYIEGTGEPMRGVQLLLGIVRQKPDDIPANMLLGKMSVQSGQVDKAIMRFETVLAKEPENKEALYYEAQAYKGKGDKEKARQLLEKCKKAVNDPEFTRKADEEISLLK
jgi:tetratricopeptide (TPR) repeat protein